MKQPGIYADTSVFGGCFDDDFSEDSKALFNEVKSGVVSNICKADAEHVAAASVAEVDFIVSWNFKHIVHYEKISGYQAVNLLNGYKPINIYSPKEVVLQ